MTISMHFVKQKLEQKQNSVHVKNFKVQKLHSNYIQNKDQKMDPSSFPKGRLQIHKKNGRDPKENEKSLEILVNSKLSNLILHLESRIEAKDNK
jgi:hypothetical protein